MSRVSPGVSTNTDCRSCWVQIPRMRWRVVWGLGETMLTLAPTRRLSSVDLPTLGRPNSVTNPLRKFWSISDGKQGQGALGRLLLGGAATVALASNRFAQPGDPA